MSGKIADTKSAKQIELAIHRLDSLPILPCVALKIFSKLLEPQFSPSELAEIIESDPALTVKILSLARKQGLNPAEERFSVRQILGKLPANLVSDALFSINVSSVSGDNENGTLTKKELVLHTLAVACCAKNIVEIIPAETEPALAYLAGMLHDIGKLAINELMPKSFECLAEEAKSKSLSSMEVEQKYLGTDHTILGKRLARKWQLPNEIAVAIWLHHSAAEMTSQSVPEIRIAQIVQLADSIARRCNIGQSGSYDSNIQIEALAGSLEIEPEQLEQISSNLVSQVEQKSKVLGLDSPDTIQNYCGTMHNAACRLAKENTKLSLGNRQLQTSSSHFDFVTDFLSSITPTSQAIEIAENFAIRWQKFYQTGMVCLYLTPQSKSERIEGVVVENLSQSKLVYLDAPAECAAIPEKIAKDFAILEAGEYADWLFEQLDVDFELSQTKLVPILSNGKAIGGLVFELRYPGDLKQFVEKFKVTTSIAGTVLGMANYSAGQQDYAEQFARLVVARPREIEPQEQAVETVQEVSKTKVDAGGEDLLAGLAEMAAGAAHELNNPLLVISGRTQLLADSEKDPEKKRILKQIKQNTDEIAQIVDGLMNFASPPEPRATKTDVKQLLGEAMQLAAQKTRQEELDVEIDVADNSKNVFVDSAQIASAVANVICNSLESYAEETGPVRITASTGEDGESVKLQITDFGCGMDSDTLQKATQPFFSNKPAGRKRGMGLSYAVRLIQINKGLLEITSEPGSGSCVTISLPCK